MLVTYTYCNTMHGTMNLKCIIRHYATFCPTRQHVMYLMLSTYKSTQTPSICDVVWTAECIKTLYIYIYIYTPIKQNKYFNFVTYKLLRCSISYTKITRNLRQGSSVELLTLHFISRMTYIRKMTTISLSQFELHV
jgi:hypothetical protein